jgi:hypothetical protein
MKNLYSATFNLGFFQKVFTSGSSAKTAGNLISRLGMILFLMAVMSGTTVYAQPAGFYSYSTATNGSLVADKDGNPIDMTTSANLYGPNVSGTTTYTGAILPMGFTLTFAGTAYTQFSVSPNGAVRLGGTGITGTTVQAPAAGVSKIIVNNILSKTGATGAVQFKTQAGTGGQVTIVEWKDMLLNSTATGTTLSTFQLRMYEATGQIEMVYGQMWNSNTSTITGSIGISSGSASTQVGCVTDIINTMTYTQTGTAFTTTTFPLSAAMTNLNSIADGSRRVITFTPPPPCATPTSQPTSLVLTPVPFSTTSITGSFTPAPTNPDGYLVVRYPSGASITDPVNGNPYGTNVALGLGTVIQLSNTTTFTATGLTTSTTYDFVVYSVNFICSGGPPYYNLVSPLFNTATTNGPGLPSCPTTYTPASGATGVATTTTLIWSGQLGSPTIYGFDVYLSTNAAAVSGLLPSAKVATAQAASPFTPLTILGTTLAPGTQYFWTVVSINSVGSSSGCVVNSFTTANPGNFTSSATGGLWSEGATWSGGVAPGFADNVTIAAGSVVTVNALVTVNNLTINGQLQWNGTANAMSAIGNILINSTGRFLPFTTATAGATGVTINIGGNFTNNGYANCAVGTTTATTLNFNGSQQGGGSLAQTLGGTGVFEGDNTYGIIRNLQFQTTGNSTLASNLARTLCVYSLTHTAGTLQTNGKLRIDNTRQCYGMPLSTQVSNVVVTTTGAGYGANPPVIFGGAVTKWTASTAATLATRYFSGNNVYLCTGAGTFGTTAPTHTGTAVVLNGGVSLLYIGVLGTLGNPYITTALTVGTQYFYGGNLYVALNTTAPAAGTPPTHTSGIGGPNSSFLYQGTVAIATPNFDAASSTLRSITLTSPGSGYSIVPILTFSNTGTTPSTTPAATVVYSPQLVGTSITASLFTKGNSATISGGIAINSDQGVSTTGGTMSGVGAVSLTTTTTTGAGVNYTVAPQVGFGFPTGINLVTNGGTYTVAPTGVSITGGTKVTGATDPTFTITSNRGKVVSVYIGSSGSGWLTPPTLAFTGGTGSGGTLAFPSGCLATADVVLGTNRQVANFTVTNPGFGYVSAPTVLMAGGTFTTVASVTAPVARLALYSLTYGYFVPATTNIINVEGVEVPANRKMNILTMSSPGFGAKFNSKIELIQSTPLSLSYGKIDMNGDTLLFSNSVYTGTATTTLLTAVVNGTIALTTRGGGTAGQTLNFPFDAPFTLFTGTGIAGGTTGSSAQRISVTQVAAPTGGVSPNFTIGNRSYKLNLTAGDTLGTARKVTLNYNSSDGLSNTMQQKYLLIGDANATTGPWTVRSDSTGATALLAPVASRTTFITPTLIDSTGTKFYCWISNTPSPTITSIAPANFCSGGGETAIIKGTGFTGTTSVKFNGVDAQSFTVNVTADTIRAIVPAGVTAGNVVVTSLGTPASFAYTVSNTGNFTATQNPSNLLICSVPGSASISLNNIGADSYTWTGGVGLDTYTGLNVVASPATSTQYTVTAAYAAFGCSVIKKFNVGVVSSVAPNPTATPANSCFGSSTTIALNSNLSAGNFGVSSITYAASTPPANAATIISNGIVQPGYVLGGNLNDGGFPNIPIGFNYNYFGNVFSTLAVSTNGVLMFGPVPGYGTADGQLGDASFGATNGLVFPNLNNPANVISLFTADMNSLTTWAATSSIKYWTEGAAPTRRFVIQFKDWGNSGSATLLNNVQCILYETTGIVEIHINNYATSGTKTIGLQDATKTIGAVAPGRQQWTTGITTPEAWRFIPPAAYTYAWSPSTYLNDSTFSAPTFTIPTSGTYNYSLDITNPTTGCVINKQLTFKVNPTPATPVVTGTLTVCGSGSTALFANTPGAGNSIKWYNGSIGGILVSTGNLYVTPVVTRDTTFFVAEQSSLCSSLRTPVTVTVATPPAFAVNDSIVCGSLSNVRLHATTNTADYDTYIWSPLTNLYQDAALNIPYTGQSLSTVYLKVTSPGTVKYICNVNSFTTLCTSRDTSTITVQPTVASISSNTVSICISGTANLTLVTTTPPGTGTVQWQSSANGITYNDIVAANLTTYTTPVISSTTYYRALIKDQSGAVCITSTPITIEVVNPQPSSTTGNTRCGTGTTTLSATAVNGTLNWYSVSTAGTSLATGTSFTTPVISATTTYYVGLTLNGCEGVRVPVIATITAPGTLTPENKKSICNNAITALTVTPGSPSDFDSYVWSPTTNLFQDAAATIPYTGQNQQTVYVLNGTSGQTVYTCLASNSVSFCANSANDTVIVLPSTATAAASVTTFCTSGTTILSLTPSTTYGGSSIHWQSSTDNSTFTDIPGANTTPFTTASLTATTYFRAEIYNSVPALCFTTNTVTVVVNPTVTGTTGGSRCGYGTVSLSAISSNGGTLKWYSALAAGTQLGTGSPFVTPAIGATTTYYVTSSAGSCESSPRIAVVATINTAPALASSAKQIVCNNITATLTATPVNIADFDSYIWAPTANLFEDASATIPYSGASLTTVYAKTSTAGTTVYVCTATNNTSNCVNVANDTVSVQPVSATITPNTTSFCDSGTTTLSLNPSTGYASGSIQWQSSADNITFTDIASANSTTYVISPKTFATKYYRARISDGVSICITTDTASVIINNPQPTSVTPNSRCGAGSVALNATSSSGTINWYSAATGGTLLATGGTFNTPSISNTTSYYASVTDAGCAGTRSLVIATKNTAPALSYKPKQVVCNNVITTLTATVVNTTDFDSYIWSPLTNLYSDAAATIPYAGGNEDTVYLKSAAAGQVVYSVHASNSTSFCDSTTSDTVFVQPATLSITPSPASICIQGSTVLSLVPSGPYADTSIHWSVSDDNINYLDTAGFTTTLTTLDYTQNKYFKARILNGSNATCLTSAVDTLRYLLPQVLSTTNAIRCGNGAVTLSATGSPGSVLKWYSVPTGGTPLFSGPSFTTPAVSSTTIYYISDSLLGCTSGRLRDTAFVNTPPDLNITATTTVCNNVITPLAVTSNTSDYTTYVWSPTNNLFQDAGATIPYTGQNLSTVYARTAIPGTYAYACNGTNPSTNCAAVANMSLTVQPASAIITSTPAVICINGTAVLSLAPSGPYAPGTIQWQRSSDNISFIDIPAAINNTYSTPVLAVTRYYQALVKNGAGATCFTAPSFTMTVNNPQVTSTTPATRCGIGPVTVSATGSAGTALSWYSLSSGGTLLTTGNSYTSPSISTTTEYWVEANSGGTGTTQISNNGVPTVTTTTVNAGLQLTINNDLTLNSVDVYATIAGSITIVLQNSAGVVIAGPVTNTVVAGTITVPQTLPLGFTIQAGVGYRLLVTAHPGGLGYHTGAFPYLMGNGVGSTTTGWVGTGTTTLNYFLYNLNTSTGCSSGRVRVTATVTPPPALTVTAPQVICNNAITSISVTSNPADYNTHKWSPVTNLFQDAAATIPYTGQNLSTVYVKGSTAGTVTYTDSASSNVSSCGNIATTTVLIQPASAVATTSPSELCVSGVGTLALTPATPYGTSTVQWQSSTDNNTFTNIVNGFGSPYTTATILSSGFYRAVIKDGAGATCFTSNSDTILVNNPQLASVTHGSRCGIGPVNLSAAGLNGTGVVWYADSTGGIPLANGNNYTTPSISHTTNYWASATTGSGGVIHTGLYTVSSTPTSGAGTTSFGLVFDVLSPFTLHSVVIYPVSSTSASGTVTIDVVNSAGTVILTKTFNVVGSPSTSPVPYTAILDFNLQPGTNYKMKPAFTGVTGLLFEPSASAPNGNYGYPFVVPGLLSINTSTLTAAPTNTARPDLYYYFYFWEINAGCESARTKVTATVTPPPALTLSSPQIFCNNSYGLLAVTSNINDFDSYTWSPATNLYLDSAGTIPYTGQNTDTVFVRSLSLTDSASYTCTASNSSSNCVNAASTYVRIKGISITSISASPITSCGGSPVTLTATTGVPGSGFHEGFETAFPGAFVAGGTGVTWAQSSVYYQEDLNSAFGTYAVSANGTLSMTNDISLVGLANPKLEFYHICATEALFDYGHIEYSLNGGSTWITFPLADYLGTGVIESVDFPGVIHFDRTSYPNWAAQFTGSTSTYPAGPATALWQHETINLASYGTATTFRMRFRVTSDVSVVYAGWAIDNVRITSTSVSGAGNYVWQWSPGGLPPGNIATVTPPVGTNVYTVTATDPTSGCSLAQTISVVVNPQPVTPTAQAPSTQCGYGVPSAHVTGSGGNLNWYLTPGGTSLMSEGFESFPMTRFALTNDSTITPLVSATQNSTYYVEGSKSVLLTHGNYNRGNLTMTSGVNLTGTVNPRLEFSHIAALEDANTAFDIGAVEYSTDGGSTWNAFPVSAYQGSGTLQVASLASGYQNPQGLQTPGISFSTRSYPDWISTFTSPTSTPGTGPATSLWKHEVVDLSAYISSNNFKVRFRLYTDPAVIHYGWLIDNVVISDGDLNAIQSSAADSLTSYSISSTTTFYVSESDGQCESGRVPIIANVTPSDAITAVATSPVCANSVLTLSKTQTGNTNNYSNIVWSASPASGSGIPTTASGSTVNITPTVGGNYIYTVVATDPVMHCAAIDTIRVSVKNPPVITAKTATPNPVCTGGDVILSAQTGTSSSGFADIGTNTATLGAANGNPYRTSAGGTLECRTNFLVLASELTASGFTAGNITSLGFTALTVSGSVINFTIKIGNTSLTALGTSYNTGPMTTVFTQATFAPVVGLNTHIFQTPFVWDGVSNIIVEVCNTQSVTGTTTIAAWTPAYSPNIGNAVAGGCTAATGSAITTKPVMRFGGTFGSTGPGNLIWSWNPGNLSGSTVTANPFTNTTFIVTALDTLTGCSAYDSIRVTVIPAPAAPTATNSVQCGLGVPKCRVFGSGGFFRWYLQPIGGSPIPGENGDTLAGYAIDTTTTFYVGEFDGTCSGARVAVTATVNQPDHLSIAASADSVCVNSPLTLIASQTGNTNAYAYVWSSTPVTGSGLNGSEINDTIIVTPTVSGSRTYTITGTDAATSCATRATKVVYVKQGPTVPVPTASPSAICPGSTSQLNANTFTSGIGSLSTGNAAGNGSSAVFFDVENLSSTLPITLHYVSVLTSGVSATAYYLPGGLTSCTVNPVIANFTQVGGTVTIVPQGATAGSPFTLVPIDLNVTIPPLGKVAVCIATNAGLEYTDGIGGCPVIASNSDIAIHEGFGGTLTGPIASRKLNGNVTYSYLVGAPNLTFSWTPPATLTDPTITDPVASPTSSTTYTVAVTDPTTLCSAIGTVAVTVNTTAGTLTVNANPTTVCNSGPVALSLGTVVPGVTYNWQQSTTGSPGSWTNAGTGSSIAPTISANTYFRVYSTCGLAGDTSNSVLVPVVDPSVTSTNSPSRCGAGPVTFTVAGSGHFYWYTGQTGGTAIASDTNTFTTNLVSTTTLWVEARIGTCIDPNRVPVTAVIFNAPVASVAVSPNDTICSGTTVSLAASSANANYTFYWTFDLVNAIDTDAVHTFVADSSRTYYLYAVDSSHQANHGCAFLVPVPIVVKQSPLAPVISPAAPSICSVGACVNLNVANGTTASAALIQVGGPSTSNIQIGMPIRAGNATAIKNQYLYTAAELSAAGLVAGNWTSFSYNYTTVTGGTIPNVEIRVGHTSATTLTTTFEPTPATSVFGPVTVNPPTVLGPFTFTFTTPFFWNGTSNVLIQICHDNPSVTAGSGNVEASNPAVNSLVWSTACGNTTGTAQLARPIVTIGGQTGSPIIYNWNPGNFTGVQYNVCPVQTTAYTVTANGGNGCTTTASVTVNYDPVTTPSITANGTTTICPGSNVTLDAGSGYASYSWSDGTNIVGTSQTYAASPGSTTTYTVTVSNGGTCTASSSQTVTVSPIITPVITNSGTSSFCQGDSSKLHVQNIYTSYSWSDGSNIVGTDSVLIVKTAATYTVTVTSGSGCSATASVVITVNPNPPAATVTTTGPINLCDDGSNSPALLTADTTGVGAGVSIAWNDFGATASTTYSVTSGDLELVVGGNTFNYHLDVTNSFGCLTESNPVTVNLVPCALSLKVKLFIEGYYTGNGLMNNGGSGGCLLASGVPGATPTQSDTIRISLMSAAPGHAFVSKATAIMETNGNVTVSFPGIAAGNYFIKITHRNALETWSKNPVAVSSTLSTYDFTTASTQAAGNNMIQVQPGKWAIYSGDISDPFLGLGHQDQIIEAQDYLDMENAVAIIKSGYTFEDITGDGLVEAQDYLIMENAVAAIRGTVTPP